MTPNIEQLAGWQGVRAEARFEPLFTTDGLCDLQLAPEPFSVHISKMVILLCWVVDRHW